METCHKALSYSMDFHPLLYLFCAILWNTNLFSVRSKTLLICLQSLRKLAKICLFHLFHFGEFLNFCRFCSRFPSTSSNSNSLTIIVKQKLNELLFWRKSFISSLLFNSQIPPRLRKTSSPKNNVNNRRYRFFTISIFNIWNSFQF